MFTPTELRRRPILTRAVAFICTDGGVVIDGLSNRKILKGALAHSVLPLLYSKLDGSRTLQELLDSTKDLDPAYLKFSLNQLESWRFLRWADTDEQASSETDIQCYLTRVALSAGLDIDLLATCQLLNEIEVVIRSLFPTTAMARALEEFLIKSGLPNVRIASPTSEEIPSTHRRLEVILGDTCEATLRTLITLASSFQVPHLRVALAPDSSYVEIGPLFSGVSSECIHCFCSFWTDSHKNEDASLEDEELLLLAAVTRIGKEILLLVSMPTIAIRGRWLKAISLPECNATYLKYVRHPDCFSCHSEGNGPHDRNVLVKEKANRTNTAVVFEDFVSGYGPPTSSPQAGMEHGKTIGHIRGSKAFVDNEEIVLPETVIPSGRNVLRDLRRPCPRKSKNIDLAELASILCLGVGLSNRGTVEVRRWNASAGNLGSADVFVAAFKVSGLPQGLYLYQTEKHTLTALRPSPGLDLQKRMSLAIGDSPGPLPDLLLLFTGALHRLAPKYGPFGYKLLQLDAGVALSQARLAAHSYGISSALVTTTNDYEISDLLRLNLSLEYPTTVLKLSSGALNHRPIQMPVDNESDRPYAGRGWRPASDYQNFTSAELTHLLAEETLTPYSAIPPFFALCRDQPKKRRPSLRTRFEEIFLQKEHLDGVLRRRRSVRRFEDKPVTIVQLETILNSAASRDRSDFGHVPTPLLFTVLARSVKGMDPGVYDYLPHRGLERTSALPSLAERSALFTQDDWGTAPVAVLVSANLGKMCRLYGAYGYRILLQRAGISAHTLSMATLSTGLSGCIFAGIHKDAVRELLSFDEIGRACCVGFVAGYPSTLDGDEGSPTSGSASDDC